MKKLQTGQVIKSQIFDMMYVVRLLKFLACGNTWESAIMDLAALVSEIERMIHLS